MPKKVSRVKNLRYRFKSNQHQPLLCYPTKHHEPHHCPVNHRIIFPSINRFRQKALAQLRRINPCSHSRMLKFSWKNSDANRLMKPFKIRTKNCEGRTLLAVIIQKGENQQRPMKRKNVAQYVSLHRVNPKRTKIPQASATIAIMMRTKSPTTTIMIIQMRMMLRNKSESQNFAQNQRVAMPAI